MHFVGLIAGMIVFVGYFCMKYIYVARDKHYSSAVTFKEVWNFSFCGHPKRREVVPIKYIAMVFVFSGLFGWGDISHKDVSNLWKPILLLTVYLHCWARWAIYEAAHWKQGVEKTITALGMLRRSVREIGWLPKSADWLSRTVYATGVAAVSIMLVRIIFLLDIGG